MIARSMVAAALLLCATSAVAENAAVDLDAVLPRLEPLCYGRFYDAAHLKAHPAQKVVSVRLLRDFPAIRLERGMESGREAKDRRSAYASVIVTYRDSPVRRFVGSATCKLVDGITRCSADSCDGGGFRMRVEGADTIVIGDRTEGAGFSVSGGCAGGENRSLNEGEDDRVFRLKRMPIAQCR